MTDLLHRRPASGTTPAELASPEFAHQIQLGRVDYVAHSPYAQQGLDEQYTGLPL